LTTISLTDSFFGLEIPDFADSVLPGPPPNVLGVDEAASLLAWADFEESLTDLSEPDVVEDDDDDDDEYR